MNHRAKRVQPVETGWKNAGLYRESFQRSSVERSPRDAPASPWVQSQASLQIKPGSPIFKKYNIDPVLLIIF